MKLAMKICFIQGVVVKRIDIDKCRCTCVIFHSCSSMECGLLSDSERHNCGRHVSFTIGVNLVITYVVMQCCFSYKLKCILVRQN